jgi:ABC-type Na+ efflux pump permease subunit
MLNSPIITRELRVALRKHKAVKSRFRVALLGAALVLAFTLPVLLTVFGNSAASSARALHSVLFCMGLFMAIVPAATVSVGLFCEERRNQTLELLYLAGVGPAELFGGKLLGGALAASSNLLALAPFLAIPFLMGGVSLDLFLATIACFPAVMLFVIAVGTLASVLFKDDGSALFCAIVVIGILCLAAPIPYGMGKMLTGMPPFSVKWLALSPAFAPYLVVTYFGANKASVFWLAFGVTIVWAALFLGLAAALLKRTWRKELEKSTASGWRAKFDAWIYGSGAWRAKLRERLLRINPYEWLVEQDRRPQAAAWAIVAGVCAVWLLGWRIWPAAWPTPMNFYATAMLMVLGVEMVMAYAGARRVGNDRRDGVLELLLTTPLMPEQIVDGQSVAMKALFRPVRATVFCLCILMAVAGFLGRSWTPPAFVSYGLIWCVILWWSVRSIKQSTPMAMWIGINSGRPAYAVFRRQNIWWWIAMGFNMRNILSMFRGSAIKFPSGSAEELTVVCFAAFAAAIIAVAIQLTHDKMRDKLIEEMRSIAREQLPEPRDPRFKNWRVTERLPRPAYLEMVERVKVYPQRMADAERAKGAKG